VAVPPLSPAGAELPTKVLLLTMNVPPLFCVAPPVKSAASPCGAVETELLRKKLSVTVAMFAPLLLRMAPPLVAPELPEKMLLLTVSVPLLQMAPPLEAPMVCHAVCGGCFGGSSWRPLRPDAEWRAGVRPVPLCADLCA
jgi:hypothetical protein